MVNDIARAYFEAPISRTVAVELPDEDKSDGHDLVGVLQKSLYGTRDAAIQFQRKVQKILRHQGFILGRYNCSTFYHPVKKLRVMVHGDHIFRHANVSELFQSTIGRSVRSEIQGDRFGRR